MTGLQGKPRYSLKALLAFVTACAVVFAACAGAAAVFKSQWTEPARVGAVAESRFKSLFAKRGWSGHAAAFHYDCRVRIESATIGDDELRSYTRSCAISIGCSTSSFTAPT